MTNSGTFATGLAQIRFSDESQVHSIELGLPTFATSMQLLFYVENLIPSLYMRSYYQTGEQSGAAGVP